MKLTIKTITIKLRMAALGIAVWSLFIDLVALGAFDSVYLSYPRTPDPETGRIVPYAFKSTVRYVTKEQMATLHWLDWTMIILAVFIVVNIFINMKWPLPSKWDS